MTLNVRRGWLLRPPAGPGSVWLRGCLGLLSVLLSGAINAQTFQWTWVSGSRNLDQAGTYGSQGIADETNHPGGRNDALSWVGPNGNFWLFGGFGHDANGALGNLNDLWRFDPETRRWTWMSGSRRAGRPSRYGPRGRPQADVTPGGRSQGYSWTGPRGNLWLFGGRGVSAEGDETGILNDLWKYDPRTGRWTWMAGSQRLNDAGRASGMGQPNKNFAPSARIEGVTWTDQQGRLWLFGGEGIQPSGLLGTLNDFWVYRPGDSTWTWVDGARREGAPGRYQGNQPYPGSRRNSAAFVDREGDLWLFGGDGYDANGDFGFLNDLWEYDVAANQWRYVNGSQTVADNGDTSAPALPSARAGMFYWTDPGNRFWVFGGFGLDAQNPNRRDLQDLYQLNPNTATWQMLDGMASGDQPGRYGPPGEASPDYLPGSRFEGVTWNGPQGGLWLMGGFGRTSSDATGRLNDLWRIEPVDTTPPFVESRNAVIYLSDSGRHILPPEAVVERAGDNRYLASTTVRPSVLRCRDIGVQTGWVVVRDPSGNMDSASFLIDVRDTTRPVLTLPRDTFFCKRADQARSFRFQWSVMDNCPVDSSQLEGPASPVQLSPGTLRFRFTAADPSGNRTEAGFQVDVFPVPEASFVIDTTSLEVEVRATNETADEHRWTWGDGATDTFSQGRHRYVDPGTYTIQHRIASPQGCSDTSRQRISVRGQPGVCYIPDAFSPNRDGLNETWKPECPQVTALEWEIYNRWGTVLSEGKGDAVWEGANEMGEPAPEGVYFYRVCFEPLTELGRPQNRRCHSGLLHLLR